MNKLLFTSHPALNRQTKRSAASSMMKRGRGGQSTAGCTPTHTPTGCLLNIHTHTHAGAYGLFFKVTNLSAVEQKKGKKVCVNFVVAGEGSASTAVTH